MKILQQLEGIVTLKVKDLYLTLNESDRAFQ